MCYLIIVIFVTELINSNIFSWELVISIEFILLFHLVSN